MAATEAFTYALIGNPNAGKTTLFNVLTGTSQHVGNWPGVTVEKKEGLLRSEYAFNEILMTHTDDMPDQRQNIAGPLPDGAASNISAGAPATTSATPAAEASAAVAAASDAAASADAATSAAPADAATSAAPADAKAPTAPAELPADAPAPVTPPADDEADTCKVTIVDLPGIYALSPYSIEERVSREYIVDEQPDVVIDIVEVTNIERNLYLTCQLAELGVPMVVAINMMDEAVADGIDIDTVMLSDELGLPVVPITAVHERGVGTLMRAVAREAAHAPHFGEDEHGHGIYDDEDAAEHIRDHHTDAFGRSTALISAHLYHNHYRGPAVVQQKANEPLDETLETQNAE